MCNNVQNVHFHVAHMQHDGNFVQFVGTISSYIGSVNYRYVSYIFFRREIS